jgi:hypothetical protein
MKMSGNFNKIVLKPQALDKFRTFIRDAAGTLI